MFFLQVVGLEIQYGGYCIFHRSNGCFLDMVAYQFVALAHYREVVVEAFGVTSHRQFLCHFLDVDLNKTRIVVIGHFGYMVQDSQRV